MHSLTDRGVPREERRGLAPNSQTLDWESVRIFLEIIRHGSFRSATEHLGLSVNALRRRIEDLEHQLGAPLMTRHVDGVRATPEGQQILLAAQRMEVASFGIIRARDGAIPSMSGEVRLAVTEGLGTFWLTPRLVEFRRVHPRTLVDLSCAMRSADVLRLEADAAVQLTKPSAPDLKVVKLGRLHIMPFAGRSYIETYGAPKTIEDFAHHCIVLQIAEQTQSQELYDLVFPGIPQIGFVAMRTNVSSAHIWAISRGAGIGWAPTYVHAIGGRMIPIEVDVRFQFDIWLTYHPDAGRIPRVRRMIDWVIDSFDPRKYPWFRDEFIHPKDLPKEYRGAPLVNLFEGFAGAGREATPKNLSQPLQFQKPDKVHKYARKR
jgi:DNA-binding transcriptional LysR family regulator